MQLPSKRRVYGRLYHSASAPTSFVNISGIRGHYPSFNGNALYVLINYYELFERRTVGYRGTECLFFRVSCVSREYLHVRYPLVYTRFIFVPRIYAWGVYPRSSVCSLIHFTLSGMCICMCMYVHMNTRYCFVETFILQYVMLSRNVYAH